MSSNLARPLVFLVIGLVVGAAAVYGALTLTQTSQLTTEINSLKDQLATATQIVEYKLGLSMPLSGELTDVGKQWQTVATMAKDDLNQMIQNEGIRAKFSLVIQDDKTSDTEALATIQTLSQAGINVIIGPAASSQVKAIKSYADDNKIVVISPSSTSPTLAIPNDFILRTVGSDAGQSKALAALVKSQSVTKVIVFHRDDEYGTAFAQFFTTAYAALGGSSVDLPYASGQADYASEVAQLSTKASQESAQGIVIITFDTDGVNILNHAKDDAFLSSLKWFSGEGIHGANDLKSQALAEFIAKTSLLGTRPVFKENPVYIDFASRYKAKVGSDPPVFSANLYDAVILAGRAILTAGSTNGTAIKEAVIEDAKTYYGASGWTMFDENGDKMIQDYSIWTVKLIEGTYQYVDVGSYSGGAITWG